MNNPLEMYNSLGSIADLSTNELRLLAKYQATASIKGDDPLVEGEKAKHFFRELIFLSKETIKQIDKKLYGKV
jgi:hypothetical protein